MERKRRYAAEATTTVEKSQGEVRALLTRYGCDQRFVGDSDDRIVVGFRLAGIKVQVIRPLPRKGSMRSVAAWEREVRRQWRLMILLLKGRLELVAEGVETPVEAFAAYVMLPDGTTSGEHVAPWVEEAYRSGTVPDLLPQIPGGPRVIALPSGTEGKRR